MRRSSPAAAFSVGFVLFVATLLAMGALFWVGSGRGIFSTTVHYQALFPSTSGLTAGSKVYLSGVPVGRVEEIDFADDLDVKSVRVTLAIEQDVTRRIRGDSYVWLQTEGLLGDNSVHIATGTGSEPARPPGSEIPVKQRTILEDLAGKDITDSTTALLRTMIGILTEMQKGEGTFGQLLKNPELYDNLSSFVSSLDQLSEELDGISGEVREMLDDVKSRRGFLGKLLFSSEYEEKIAKAMEESTELIEGLNRIASTFEKAEGTIGKLIADPAFHDKGLEAVANASRLAASLDQVLVRAQGERSVLGRILTDREMGRDFASLVERLERGAESLEVVLRLLEDGEGSIGMVLHDPSIAASLRNVFYGVQEAGYVLSLVRNAELEGRELELRHEREGREALMEAGRVRAAVTKGTVDESRSPETRPAAAKEEGTTP